LEGVPAIATPVKHALTSQILLKARPQSFLFGSANILNLLAKTYCFCIIIFLNLNTNIPSFVQNISPLVGMRLTFIVVLN